jgi:hypothetical protein
MPGKGGWTFAPVPDDHAPPVTESWGRTPVTAIIGGHRWRTSVWREQSGRTLLPISTAVRTITGCKAGDRVTIQLEFTL